MIERKIPPVSKTHEFLEIQICRLEEIGRIRSEKDGPKTAQKQGSQEDIVRTRRER